MAFYADSDKLMPVEWYFVPDGRDVIPFQHAFGTTLYERTEQTQDDIGERFSPVPWRGGTGPCPETTGGLCGIKDQWQHGASISDPLPATWPGTKVPRCCKEPEKNSCGGEAYFRAGFGACHMESTCDIYSPFGAGGPSAVNVPCQFVQDLATGRGTSPLNVVCWTHYIDVAEPVAIFDGCTRTLSLDTINYADGDEVRIPSGGSARYVVVWVTLCDTEATVVKRCFLLRHGA